MCFAKPSTTLPSDKVSIAIINEAGDKVKNELIDFCPKGVTPENIAITSAGCLTSLRKLYHICDVASVENGLQVTIISVFELF